MISRKTGARLKKLKTLKIKRRGKRGGMFEAQAHPDYSAMKMPSMSPKTNSKFIALAGQSDLLLDRLGMHAARDLKQSPQFAIQSYIEGKQRHFEGKKRATALANKLLEDSKEFRKRNDFVNAALLLRQAIDLGSLPARAELADFFRTGRRMKEDPNDWDKYYDDQNNHNKAHELVYGQDDPDCKGVLALLYLDYLDHRDNFSWRLPNDPLFDIDARTQMGEAARRLAQESEAAGSKYGVYALGRWNWWNAREIHLRVGRIMSVADCDDDAEMGLPPSGETNDERIERLRSEIRRAQRDGVVLIGIAANPPYSYDVAQHVYATCITNYVDGVSLMHEPGKDQYSVSAESDKYFEMAAAQGFRESRRMR